MRGCCPDCRGTGRGDWSDPYGCPSCYRTGHLHPEEEKCDMGKTLDDWQAEVREINEANGWHDTERTFGDGVALLHSEVSEMFEAYRDHGLEDRTGVDHLDMSGLGMPVKPEGVGSEMADIFIRLVDEVERTEIDLEWEVTRKLAYNRTRGHRHGGKRV